MAQSKIPNRCNWFREGEFTPSLRLERLTDLEIGLMFDRTLKMFEYKGLPDGITSKDMEKFTQLRGMQFFIKYKDRYYILEGSFINENLTWNKEPTEFNIVNVALPDLPSTWTIDNAVIYPNDSLFMGLYDLFESRAIQIASCDISLLQACINTRFRNLFTASDDNTRNSINKVIEDVVDGKSMVAITAKGLLTPQEMINSVPFSPSSENNNIKDLIELKQYLKSTWYMELGIDANYNMKREAINENEAHMNDEALLPLIDDMMDVRKKAIDTINSKWGLNISIDFSSAWKKLRDEIKLNNELKEKEVKALPDKEIEEGSDDKAKTKEDEEHEEA